MKDEFDYFEYYGKICEGLVENLGEMILKKLLENRASKMLSKKPNLKALREAF